MPYLVQRFLADGTRNINPKYLAAVPNGFIPEARKCFYDTSQIPSKGAMLALRTMVPTSQILFGTDYPYKEFDWTEKMLLDDAVFNAREMQGIFHQNAAALFA
jgi:predicted TIM-barrel fold metal-dependent hydrolase